MKKLSISVMLLFFLFHHSISQNLSGAWEGELQVMGQSLPLVFNFQQMENGWTGTMDSPKQGVRGISLSKILFDGLMLHFEVGEGVIVYDGLFVGQNIQGTFKQSGLNLPLDLKRALEGGIQEKEVKRPQTPQPPHQYESFETSFINPVGNQLKGTITKPFGNGSFPAVILVSGSGPQNRNSEIFGHEPFLVMADYFTQNGIVVLRYDERGVGESEGEFSSATSKDFFKDAQEGIRLLKSFDFVDPARMGMIGHSEGGLIAWMTAADAEDLGLQFVVSLTGPVVNIPDLMKKQTEDVSRSAGNPKELVEQQLRINSRFYKMINDSKSLEDAISKVKDLVTEEIDKSDHSPELKKQQINALVPALEKSLNPWFFNFIRTNPEDYISKIKIPVFAAFGGKDVQVNAAQNGNRLLELFRGREELLEMKVYSELNHLLQKAKTGAVSEYAEIEETFNVEVLRDMANFILGLKK